MNNLIELDKPNKQELAAAQPSAPALVSREAFERRCVAQIGALLDEANRHNLKPTFVWVATWHLATVMHACGPRAVADVMANLGGHLRTIVDREIAEREAEEAKAAGRLPQ